MRAADLALPRSMNRVCARAHSQPTTGQRRTSDFATKRIGTTRRRRSSGSWPVEDSEAVVDAWREILPSIVEWGPAAKLYALLKSRLSPKMLGRMKAAVPGELFLPDEQLLRLYQSKTRVNTDKARRLLGYRPAFDFDRGMRITAEYMRRTTL